MSRHNIQAALQRVEEAISQVRLGKMVIMVDNENRENEGDIVVAADFVTPEHIAFMAKEASGLICLTLAASIADRLSLPLMVDETRQPSLHTTAFTLSIEARAGVTTGISAIDRAHTIRVAIDPKAKPNDLVVPGHIFPLRAKEGGVIARAGHTEGSVDLMRFAGLTKAAVICEVMNVDGSMARMADLEVVAQKHDIHIVTIDDLVVYSQHYWTLARENWENRNAPSYDYKML